MAWPRQIRRVCAPRHEFNEVQGWIHRNLPSFHYILHDILHDIRQTWFLIRSLTWKEAKIHDIWHELMKNYEFWCTKKCPGKEFISEFIYELMGNSEFKIELMKKTYISGVPRSVPSKNLHIWIYIWIHIHTCELIYEFVYEIIFMTSYVNSNMN